MNDAKVHEHMHRAALARDFLDILREYRSEIEADLFGRFRKSADQEEWPALHRMLIGIEAFERWAVRRIENGKLAKQELDDILDKQER
jgi:hypothetical protein